MPATWESVASNPKYQALPPEQQVAARKQYFDTVVAPQVPKEHLDSALQQFESHAAKTSPRSFVDSMGDRAGEALDQKPGGVASLVRSKMFGFDPITAVDKTFGVAAAPLGAAGETLERGVGKALGADPIKLEKAARDTGDVAGDLLGIMPGPKVASGAKAVGEGALAAGRGVEEGANIMKMGFHARDAEALDQKVLAMEKGSDLAAMKMREMGVRFKPETTQALLEHIETNLKPLGTRDVNLHGETMKVLDDMKTASSKGFDMQDLDIYRKRFRQIANKGGEDGKMAGEALDSIREAAEAFREKLPKGASFVSYVDQWAQARRFDTLADIVKAAGGDPQKIKSGFDKLLKNDRKMRGFSKEEKEAIKEASQYTAPEKLMRLAGRFGFELGSTKTVPSAVLPGAELLYGGAYHNPYMLPLVVGGTAARAGGKYLARGKAERAMKAVEDRGLNKALGSETDPLAAGANP